MIDSLTVMEDVAGRFRAGLAGAGVTGWQVVADFGGPREADEPAVLVRLVNAAATTPGLPTWRLDCQVILSKGCETDLASLALGPEVLSVFEVLEGVVRGLAGEDVVRSNADGDDAVLAKYQGARLEQLRSGIMAESGTMAPVGELVLFVYFAE